MSFDFTFFGQHYFGIFTTTFSVRFAAFIWFLQISFKNVKWFSTSFQFDRCVRTYRIARY